jgi:hypothetical protein
MFNAKEFLISERAQNMKERLTKILNEIDIERIRLKPCYDCYVCRNVSPSQCNYGAETFRLQWKEQLPENSFWYPENDGYLYCRTKDATSFIESILDEETLDNLELAVNSVDSTKFVGKLTEEQFQNMEYPETRLFNLRLYYYF